MIKLLFITAMLGLIKNYIKYKKIKFLVFIRSPIIYFLINILLKQNNIWKILIYERWFFFIFKSIKSYIKNDYKNKKNKYIKKYNLNYN